MTEECPACGEDSTCSCHHPMPVAKPVRTKEGQPKRNWVRKAQAANSRIQQFAHEAALRAYEQKENR